MSRAILFHFLCTQHVSDINISIIRSLRLCCGITTSVVLFSVRCVLEIWCGCVIELKNHNTIICFSQTQQYYYYYYYKDRWRTLVSAIMNLLH